jgi:hypothetical protein
LEKKRIEAVTPCCAARFPMCAFSSGVKCSYDPRLDDVDSCSWLSSEALSFSIRLTSLFAAAILDEGTVELRGPSGWVVSVQKV